MTEKDVESCDSCGAAVYPEHLESGKAGVASGKLMCPHCLAEYKKTHHDEQERLAGMTTMKAPGEGEELESLSVIEDDSSQASQIRSISSDTLAGAAAHLVDESHYRRPLNPPELPGATRCRTFHAKLNDGAVAYMNNQINEWADENPGVSIKYAASTIGVWEGKKADPHLILSVFY